MYGILVTDFSQISTKKKASNFTIRGFMAQLFCANF